MRSFNPHVGSFHSPTWGYQKHNSYRVAMLHNAFIMQYSANCKTIFRLFIPHVAHFIRQRGVFRGTTRTELRCHTARLWCCITRIMQTIFRPFIPHVGSFHSPTWGLQRHNSYRVAMLYSAICGVVKSFPMLHFSLWRLFLGAIVLSLYRILHDQSWLNIPWKARGRQVFSYGYGFIMNGFYLISLRL